VMLNDEVSQIATFDRGFDRLNDITRVRLA
jgi:predicted nucleic acid-binding protein